MAARIKLYVDWLNKRLQQGLKNGSTFTLPKLYQGDKIPMQVYIVEPDPDAGVNAFAKIDIANMALQLAISTAPVGNAAETPFVTQYTWSKNTIEGYFYADVEMGAGVATFLGALSEKDAYMELEITEGASIATVWQGSVTVRAEIIEAGSLQVAAGSTPLSLEVAKQMFASKRMDPGETLTFVSSDGLSSRILGVNNDKSGIDYVI